MCVCVGVVKGRPCVCVGVVKGRPCVWGLGGGWGGVCVFL